jgi:hypothetical protein
MESADDLSSRKSSIGSYFSECRRKLSRTIGFGKKAPALGQDGWSFMDNAGRRDDLDWGPAAFDRCRQLEAIHVAWHLNISEQNGDIRPAFKNCNFIRVRGFDHVELGFFNYLSRV